MTEDERSGLVSGPGSGPGSDRVRGAVFVPGSTAAQSDPGQPAGVSSAEPNSPTGGR